MGCLQTIRAVIKCGENESSATPLLKPPTFFVLSLSVWPLQIDQEEELRSTISDRQTHFAGMLNVHAHYAREYRALARHASRRRD